MTDRPDLPRTTRDRAPGIAADGVPHGPRESDSLWSPDRRALTIGLVLNVTIVASEALAVSTIMPIVARDLGGIDLYGWVFSGFFLGNLLGIVIAGMMIDRGGLARPFILGIGLFAIGLLIGGIAPSMAVLVAARVLQGLGAGAIPAVAYVSIARAMPEHLRPRMFAILSTAWVLPGVIGPTLAAFVGETWHWRLVFIGLLPIIAVAAWLTLPSIRAVGPAALATPQRDETSQPNAARRRLPLAIVLVVGAGLVVSGLSNVSSIPLVLIAAGVLIGVPAFARLTPPGTIRAATGLPAAVLLRGFLTFAFFCADVYVPLAIQDWRGAPALLSGVVYTAATLTWTAGAWIQAHNVARIGPGRFLVAGFATLVLGIVGFATILSPDVPLVVGVLMWGVAGFGMGLSYSTLSLVVLREAAPEQQGAATAGLQLSDVLGTALGTGVGGALIAFGARAGEPAWIGLGATFGIAIVVAIVGLGLTPRLGRRASRGELPALAEPATG
ncbi:MAG: MFS transporter [Chloroflexi bacterium]|nr:MFS transporter [Chloroflexota bacterium]